MKSKNKDKNVDPKIKNNKNTQEDVQKFSPVFFPNFPQNDVKKDVFDFGNQINVLNTVTDSGAKIIGIIGNYGSGKSSITEMFETEQKNKKKKIIRVNLWDCSNDVSLSGESKKLNPFSSLMKTFFYQLAYANNMSNRNFADYVNSRFNKNLGRVSLQFSTKKAFFAVIAAALMIFMFFSFNTFDFHRYKDYFKNPQKTINYYIHLFYFIRYLFVILAGGFLIWAIRIAAPIFTSWKSEGSYVLDNSDISEVYNIIIQRILPKSKKKKVIVFIDDLDRMADYKTVDCFLKELYRCVNILPKEQSNRILFIVSLKPEEVLKSKEQNVEFIYPKIFDYTLNIKPMHCETYYYVVKDLLEQNKESLKEILKEYSGDDITGLLTDLLWLYKDENVTIRELKERLNETFLLYQILHNRDPKIETLKINKVAAVIYLKRRYKELFYKIIKREHDFAEFIRDCYKISDKTKLTYLIQTFLSQIEANDFSSEEIKSFISDFSDMLSVNLIEEDFALYFYNYPKHGYIKTIDEKDLFNSIVFSNCDFLSVENCEMRIKNIIEKLNGNVIKEAFEKYSYEVIPPIIYRSPELFKFVIEKLPNQKKQIFKEIIEQCRNLDKISLNNEFYTVFGNLLNFSFNRKIYDELVNKTLSSIIECLKQSRNVNSIRNKLIEVLKDNVEVYSELYTTDNLPCITAETYKLLEALDIQENIITKMSEKRLKEFDDLVIDSVRDHKVIEYLQNNNLYKTVLSSEAKSKRLDIINFESKDIQKKLFPIIDNISNKDNNLFIQIRKEILRQLQYKISMYNYDKLYFRPYPVITKEELDILKINNLFEVIDFSRLNNDIQEFLIKFSKNKIHNETDFYRFLKTLLFNNKNELSDPDTIKQIMNNINFTKINIRKINNERLETIINILSPVYNLDEYSGCLQFMQLVHHLIPTLEENVIKDSFSSNYYSPSIDEYLEFINSINEATELTVNLLINNNINNTKLCPAITDILYNKKSYYLYVIGKTLYDKKIPSNNKISHDIYYEVFKQSDNCLPFFAKRIDLLYLFEKEEFIYRDNISDDRLKYFYLIKQNKRLVQYILTRIDYSNDEIHNYFVSLRSFASEGDAISFIKISESYIDLFRDKTVFNHIKGKLWNQEQRQTFCDIVNKTLGTEYKASEQVLIKKKNKRKRLT